MSAEEALSLGLVSRVFPTETLVDEAIQLGERISGFSKIAVAMCKEAVNAAEQLPLNEGSLAVVRPVFPWISLYTLGNLCILSVYLRILVPGVQD